MAIIMRQERTIIVVKSNVVLFILMSSFYSLPDMLDVYFVCSFSIVVISK